MVKVTKSSVLAELLTEEALVSLSGPKVFDRGLTYAASGAVRVIEESQGIDARIRAQIDGTQVYETSISVDGDVITGDCDCPHAGDGWFCKHQVALCLTWRDRLAGAVPVVDESARRKVQAAARRAQTQRDQREALHEFLRAQPASALAERLIDLADQVTDIERELRLWQKSAGAAADPEHLRALVSEALTVRGQFLPLPQVRGWVRQAETILPLLSQSRGRDASTAAGVALHALRRCWAAIQKSDDSNGEIGDLCSAIAAEWVACLQQAGAQPASFGDTWLRVQLEDPFGCMDRQSVEQSIGTAALTRYRALLGSEWQKSRDSQAGTDRAGKRSAHGTVRDEAYYRFRRIEDLHVTQLLEVGDIDNALAVKRADLSEAHRCRDVTRFLEHHGRLREAFACAEDACRRFPDDWQIQDDLLRNYERDGWLDEAHALLRRQFQARPDVPRYLLALESGVAAGREREALRTELFAAMEQIEAAHMQAPLPRFASEQERRVARQSNVSLRAAVLCAEQRLDEALQLVQPPAVCHPAVLREIALKLGTGQRKAAVELLQRVFVYEMRTAQTPYRDEIALVKEIAARMDAKSRASWLAQLRTQFKAKRNFTGGLPE